MRKPLVAYITLIAMPLNSHADGGISALGAMMPIFIVLAVIGAATGIWTIYSLVLVFASTEKNTPRRRKVYTVYSFTLIAIIVLATLIGSTFLSAIALFIGVALALMLSIITSAVVARAARRSGESG